MDFSVIFQLRTKRFWWMDVIFYFVVSLLIATIFCYIIFLIKNTIQREDIKKMTVALETVGTEQQKEYERSVISYQKKISDFAKLFKNHEFASHVFNFMQEQTMPNIWFKQFSLDRKNKKAQLFGEADDMEAFSRQVAHFEKNEYVKNVGTLNSALGEFARVQFNLNLALDSEIFSYVPETIPMQETALPSSEPVVQPSDRNSQKLITVFDLLLTPEVIGRVDQANYTIALDVPYDTNITNMKPLIISSPGAKVSPASGVSQDFTYPIVYTVTALDGSSQKYTVTVSVLSKTGVESSRSGSSSILLIVIVLLVVMALVFLAAFWFFKKRLISKQQTPANHAS